MAEPTTTLNQGCDADESVIVSSFQSEHSSCDDQSLSLDRSKMVQVEGDIQPSSSSQVGSETWNRNDVSPEVSSETEHCNSIDEFFVTPSLPFDDDGPVSEDYDLRISEDYDVRSKDVATNYSTNYSIASLDSLDPVQMEKNAAVLGTESSSEDDEDSYFPTAQIPDEAAPRDPNRERKVEDCTNDVANKSTVAQVEPVPATTCPTETVKVFITYALELEHPSHMKSVASMAVYLSRMEYLYKGPKSNTLFKFEVIADVFDKEIEAQSKSIWLEGRLKQADFVLVCVSPGYSDLVELIDETKDKTKEQNETDFENSVHTQYIYRRMHSEYINNGSKNQRFIPVLFTGASRDDVPNWLRDTLVYRWSTPADYKHLIFRLIRKEEHLKPTPGSLPELQIRSRFQSSAGTDKRRT